jgi:hypothetical protein
MKGNDWQASAWSTVNVERGWPDTRKHPPGGITVNKAVLRRSWLPPAARTRGEATHVPYALTVPGSAVLESLRSFQIASVWSSVDLPHGVSAPFRSPIAGFAPSES